MQSAFLSPPVTILSSIIALQEISEIAFLKWSFIKSFRLFREINWKVLPRSSQGRGRLRLSGVSEHTTKGTWMGGPVGE